MNFPICKVRGAPAFDILPVAKITNYPTENWDYKPFAQCRIAVNEQNLFVQIWAFEAKPEPLSSITCALMLPTPLILNICADGKTAITLAQNPVQNATCHPFDGDDLQGVYWGGTFTLPLVQLQDYCNFSRGDVIKGNFYKQCSGVRPHFGSYAPVPDQNNPFEPTAMADLTIINF